MRLIQLKLAGFKSFVEPSTISISSQLVGVVGPNGCGKSNIIDAVRWVLGEAKASELRGESMQDVIFNGSIHRKPAARASVELVFDNSSGRAVGVWSRYTELAIRRVLTRDGISHYFVNNQGVRRRDIYDIFLGTGLGVRGYAIIGQGMIARLIEARPDELRIFLEEAAGVSRYKERRRETENRLTDARENLTRIADILYELNEQLEKLLVQAEVARQYQALQTEHEQKQHILWMLKEKAAHTEHQHILQEIAQAQILLESDRAELQAVSATLETHRQAHYAMSDTVHQAQGALYEANALVGRLEVELRHGTESRHRLQTRQAQLQQHMVDWQVQYDNENKQIDQIKEDLLGATALIEDAEAKVEITQTHLTSLENQWQKAIKQGDQQRSVLAQFEQNIALMNQSQQQTERQNQNLQQRRQRLEQLLQSLHSPTAARLEQVAAECTVSQQQVKEIEQELLALEARVTETDQQRAIAQHAAQADRQDLSQLQARLTALVKLQQAVQKQEKLEPWLAKHLLIDLPRLWQKLQIEPGWESALEAVLRERLMALEIDQLETLKILIEDPPPTRLAFYQLSDLAFNELSSSALINPPLKPLTQLLHLTDPHLGRLMNHWLQEVYSVKDLTQALVMRATLPHGVICVTPEGHIIEATSVRFYAPDFEQAGILARQQEIENLSRETKAKQLMLEQTQATVTALEKVWQQLNQALKPTRLRLFEVNQRSHNLKVEYSSLQQQAEQAKERANSLRQELDEISFQEEVIKAQRLDAEIRLKELEQELRENQVFFSKAEIKGQALAQEVEQSRTYLRQCERQAQEAEFSHRSLQLRITELQRHQHTAENQTQLYSLELQTVTAELNTLDISSEQKSLQEALTVRAEREKMLLQCRVEMDNLSSVLRETDEKRMRQELSIEPRRARITELQLQEQAARLAETQFREQLEAKNSDREALTQLLSIQPAVWHQHNWLQSEMTRLSRKIESFGSVNLAAVEELNTARERKNYLDGQQQDLLGAIETLENAIRKIDRETRELLQNTFNTVNGHFGELFPVLFGGGEAKLTMTGEEILDAGIQVMAQPPGKRNSTIHLLSGGEKALTATALVFALFKLNPAPFCLLDEVDAPLDDANTERYAQLVSAMSAHTQFLFISHNKIAMQMAKQLVGVTMQEQGVSRIVAVDMDMALQISNAT